VSCERVVAGCKLYGWTCVTATDDVMSLVLACDGRLPSFNDVVP